MGLFNATLETINNEWSKQRVSYFGDCENALTIVYLQEDLAKAIESSGFKVPEEFDPNQFNDIEDGTYFQLDIKVRNQKELIEYHYE